MANDVVMQIKPNTIRINDVLIGGIGEDTLKGSDAGEAIMLFNTDVAQANDAVGENDPLISGIGISIWAAAMTSSISQCFHQQSYDTDAVIDGGAGDDVLLGGWAMIH